MNIIIGNNSVILRNILGEILIEAGNEVACLTANGKEIVDVVKTSDIDLVILGENLAQISEYEIIEILKNEAPVAFVLMGDFKNTRSMAPQKIIPKPEMDTMGDKKYQKELLKQLNQVVDIYKNKTTTIKSKVRHKIEHIVIGSSTGGPNALKLLLDSFPVDFPIPISIIQHMEEGHEKGLASWLNKSCKLHVRMAVDNDKPKPGEVIMGEQGRHLSVNNRIFNFTDEEKVQFQKPSVDVLFSTAAKCYKTNLLGVLLTGMGRDGATGCQEIIKFGGTTVVQDEATSTVYGMPKAAVELNAATVILPLQEISDFIISTTKMSNKW